MSHLNERTNGGWARKLWATFRWLVAGALLLTPPMALRDTTASAQSTEKAAPEKSATEKSATEKPVAGKAEATKPDAGKPGAEKDGNLVRLSKTHEIWLDLQNKQLIVAGQVCLKEGFLEMFACPKGTKEHESVVSVNSDAMTVHAGLLALGAQIGGPVKFDPKFTPASGTVVDIFVTWTDAAGKAHKVRAQEWVRNSRTKKELHYDWVFAGSGFFTDEDSGKRYYNADTGDLVCVSNFPTATLDLPIESSQTNAELQFEAFTEHIPAKGTKLKLIFQPKAAAKPTGKPKE